MNNSDRSRLLTVWGLLVAAALGLGCRLYYLQIIEGEELRDKARQQQTVNLRPYIPRRAIVDDRGNVIATDRIVFELYAHPQQFKIPTEEVAKKLAKILDNYTANKLVKIFNSQKSGIRLAYALPEAKAEQISRLALDGLESIEHYYRYYPQEETFADVIGYVKRGEHQGKAGIEYSQQTLLERPLSKFKVTRYGNGAVIPEHVPPGLLKVDELKLQLTLNMRLQRAARSALKKQIKKFNGKRGAAIVMDVRDGSILALVCEPTFNPNKYGQYDLELFKNWAVSDLYEPGSTFKPIVVAIALDAKVIQPDTIIDDTGKIKIDGWNIYNHDYWNDRKGRGEIGLAKILQHSSNVGMIKIVEKLERADYYQKLENLGLKEKVGVDLPGDAPGHLKNKKLFTSKEIEAATASFGQGLSLTPLKLAQLHAAIANGGKLVTPHLVRGLVDFEGQIHWQPRLKERTIFSDLTSRNVLEMMETVVTEGSGKKAIIEGYRIAGKTGTAQKASKSGGYKPGAKIVSFVAILPVEDPRYVVLTLVDEPRKPNAYGSTVAAPIAKSIMEALISIEGLPPTTVKKN
ncbi:MAG: peptidoglycan D,D-transpeptidase FtsI family protein [Prochloraceae cyanobacterium]